MALLVWYTPSMQSVHKFQVFVNEKGEFGNLGSLLVDDSGQIEVQERIRITSDIGNDETVFVDDLATNRLSIYHHQGEVDFAGSVLVGVVWQLEQIKGEPTQTITCRRGSLETWQEEDVYWLRTAVDNNIGNWEYLQLEKPEDVDNIKVEETQGWSKLVWAWVDEDKGLIRARTFASKIGIPEVQGNGSGSLNLAGQLQKEIVITHGDGSVIYARPASGNRAELGGRVIGL